MDVVESCVESCVCARTVKASKNINLGLKADYARGRQDCLLEHVRTKL